MWQICKNKQHKGSMSSFSRVLFESPLFADLIKLNYTCALVSKVLLLPTWNKYDLNKDICLQK